MYKLDDIISFARDWGSFNCRIIGVCDDLLDPYKSDYLLMVIDPIKSLYINYCEITSKNIITRNLCNYHWSDIIDKVDSFFALLIILNGSWLVWLSEQDIEAYKNSDIIYI